MDQPAASAVRPARYLLFFHDGRPRLRMMHRDEGIELRDDGLAVFKDGVWIAHRYADIISVGLTTYGAFGTSQVGMCTITFRSLEKLVVLSSAASGHADPRREADYRDFVADLHRRLAAAGAGARVSFQSGWDETKHMTMISLVVLLTMIMVPAPLALLFTGELRALAITIAAGFIVWPLWSMIRRNAPAEYTPEMPPDLLA